jgi:hypothetical protein
VMSLAVGAGATMVSVTEKVGISATPPIRGEQDDLCMADPRPTQDPQVAKAGGGVPALRMTYTGAYTSPPTAATSTNSKRCRAQSGAYASVLHPRSMLFRRVSDRIFFASFGSRLPIELKLG